MGFQTENKIETLALLKYHFFKEGISPREFRKCQMRDILEIIELKDAIEEKEQRERNIEETMSKMKKW
jgi:hypothetical protein